MNRQMAVTIFLTTQYLEEADALADRVGIINRGRLIAQGTPAELKRSLSNDVVIVQLDAGANGQVAEAKAALAALDGVADVDASGSEVIVQVANGAAEISNIALALNEHGIHVNELTLRTPTLDDVFLSVAGARMEHEAGS